MAQRTGLLLAFALLTSSAGCAVRLVAPQPDPGGLKPVRVAARPSHVAVVARLAHTQVAALVDTLTVQPVDLGQQVQFAGWKLHIERAGKVTVRADNDRLCVAMPFSGAGRIEVVGKTLERALRAELDACAELKLAPGAVLTLVRPTAAVRVGGRVVGGMTQVLYDALEHHLRAVVSPQLLRATTELRIPLTDALEPLLIALDRPRELADGACLKLRPERVRLGQPEVDPTQVRLAISAVTRPTVERPCAPPSPPQKPVLEVVEELDHPMTELDLPIGVAVRELREPLLAELRKAGRIRHAGGWVEVTDVTLHTAAGAVLARATVIGETEMRLFGLGWTREVGGQVTLWGVPGVTEQFVGVDKVELAVDTDDAVTDLVASLRASDLRASVQRRLRWPRADLEKQAAKLLTGLAAPLKVGDQSLPVRIETRALTIESARANADRVEVQVHFEGQIVIGSTRRR